MLKSNQWADKDPCCRLNQIQKAKSNICGHMTVHMLNINQQIQIKCGKIQMTSTNNNMKACLF